MRGQAGCDLFRRQWPLPPETVAKSAVSWLTGSDVPRLPECVAAETA
jgi:hypothetical protein